MTARLDRESQLILNIVTGNAALKPAELQAVSWDRVFRLASLNRVLYVFARSLRGDESVPKSQTLSRNLDAVITEGDRWLAKLKSTLEFARDTLDAASIPYLCVKTDRDLPYVTFDVDILVKPTDFEKALADMRQAGAQTSLYAPKDQADAERAGLLRIDLHRGFYCRNAEYFSHDLMWDSPQEAVIQQVACPAPNPSAELALMTAHAIHERFHFPLLELLFLKKMSHQMDSNVMLEQARRYDWEKAARRYVAIINALGEVVFNEEKPLITVPSAEASEPSFKLKGTVSLPFMFPLTYSAAIFGERLRNRKPISLFDVGYYLVFTRARYRCTRRLRVPMYGHWYPLDELKW